jgi:hypothetical protein
MYERLTRCSPNTKLSAKFNFSPLLYRPDSPIPITSLSALPKVLPCYQTTLTRRMSGHSLENFRVANFMFHPPLGRLKRLNNQDRCKSVLNCGQAAELQGLLTKGNRIVGEACRGDQMLCWIQHCGVYIVANLSAGFK